MQRLLNENFATICRDGKIKSAKDLLSSCKQFAQNLLNCGIFSEEQKKEIYLKTDDFYYFLVAFFGAFLAGFRVYILQKDSKQKLFYVFTNKQIAELLEQKYEQKECDFSEYLALISDSIESLKIDSMKNIDFLKLPQNLEECEFFIETSASSGEAKFVLKNLRQMAIESAFLAKFFGFYNDEKIQKNLQNFQIQNFAPCEKLLNLPQDSIEAKKQNSIFTNSLDIESTSQTPRRLVFSSVSHNHLYGLSFKCFLPLLCGFWVSELQIMFSEFIFRFCEKFKNSIYIASPVMLRSLANAEHLERLGSLAWIFSAGGKLDSKSAEILRSYLATNAALCEIYGSSEAGVIAQNTNGFLKKLPLVEISLNDNSQMQIKSPWSVLCEGGRAIFSDDCAVLDGDKITLLGRSDRILKLHDRKISAEQIEELLRANALISDASVGFGESENRLCAILVLSQNGVKCFFEKGKKGLLKEITNALPNELCAKLRYFYIKDSLPYNERGKISRFNFLNAIKERTMPQFSLLCAILENGEILSKEFLNEKFGELKIEHNFIIKSAKTTDLAQIAGLKEMQFSCFFSPASFFFGGHFGGFAIVPGFVQIGFVAAMSAFFGLKNTDLFKLEVSKFSGFIRASKSAIFRLWCQDSIAKKKRFYFEIKVEDKICASGRWLLDENSAVK